MDSIVVDTKKLYTKSEYAKTKGISRPTLDKYIEEKKVPSVNIHGAILVLAL